MYTARVRVCVRACVPLRSARVRAVPCACVRAAFKSEIPQHLARRLPERMGGQQLQPFEIHIGVYMTTYIRNSTLQLVFRPEVSPSPVVSEIGMLVVGWFVIRVL